MFLHDDTEDGYFFPHFSSNCSRFSKVYIPRYVAQCLADLKKEQYEIIEALGSEYQNYNLVMATTFGLPIGDSYLRDQMQRKSLEMNIRIITWCLPRLLVCQLAQAMLYQDEADY